MQHKSKMTMNQVMSPVLPVKRLLSFFDRIERLEEEKAALAEDIKEVYAEAKAAGFEVKIMRRIMKLRKMEVEKRREEDELT